MYISLLRCLVDILEVYARLLETSIDRDSDEFVEALDFMEN